MPTRPHPLNTPTPPPPPDEQAFTLLTTMGPSSLDSELRLLSPHSGGTMNLLNEFCLMIIECLVSKKQYELVNSYFSLFLQVCYASSQTEAYI